MTWPTIGVYAAFGGNPYTATASQSWTDISTYVRGMTVRSPRRSRMLDTFTPGGIDVLLDNSDRRFDPTNLSGPYASGGRSQIVPNLPLKAEMVYSATTYSLGHSFKDSGKPTWFDPGWAETEWSGTDAFKLLNRFPRAAVTAVGDAELSGARSTRILDSAGWSAGDRSIGTGLSRMQATTLDGSPLSELQLVAASEGGEVWVAPNNAITFKDRSYRTSTTTWTLNDTGGSLDFVEVSLVDDEEHLTNWASITKAGGSYPQVYEDTTSQTRYGKTSDARRERTDLVMFDDSEAMAIAQMTVDIYSDSIVRFETIELNPTVNDSLWPLVGGARIGDRFAITRTPPGGGSAITRTCFLEGWTTTFVALDGGAQGECRMECVLSDAQDAWSRTFFVLDTSALDGSHVLLW